MKKLVLILLVIAIMLLNLWVGSAFARTAFKVLTPEELITVRLICWTFLTILIVIADVLLAIAVVKTCKIYMKSYEAKCEEKKEPNEDNK